MKPILLRYFARSRVTLKSRSTAIKGLTKEKAYIPTLLPKYEPLFIQQGKYTLPLIQNPFISLHEKTQRVELKEGNQYITHYKTEEGEQLIFYQKQNLDKFINDKLSTFQEKLYTSLTPQQLYTTQGYGFERPFTGEYHSCLDYGMYVCRVCSQRIFMSDHKFIDTSGYAAFWGCIPEALAKRSRNSSDIVICSNVYR